MQHNDSHLTRGSTFDERYEILALLGEGGFGTVYKARQRTTGQNVALKILRLDHGGGAQAEKRISRFLLEARVCGQLHHPNIVQLIDSGQTGQGVLYTSFAFAPGQTLADVIAREGALAPREATHLMLQVLDALACAHAQGVVHRDLKPGNVMVIPSGARRNALVLDFGIGVMIGGRSLADQPTRLTATDEVLGTPGYMAPEQLRGLEPTPRTDLFAWGLLFLECLTGRMVYGAETAAEALYRLLGPEPVPIPAEIERTQLGALLRRAVQKDVAARDVNARDLLHALEALDPRSLVQQSRGGQAASLAAHTLAATEAAQGAGDAQASSERRQITAVCCVLEPVVEGSVDDEELDELVHRASATCADIAARHRGHVVAAIGDKVMLYFGLLRAEEDDAKRAARAALAIVEAIGIENDNLGRARGVRLDVRIGLHTGIVHASGLREGAAAGLASGAMPRVAARVAREALPATIMVSAETHRLLRASFELEGDGARSIEGRRGALETFRLHKARADRGTPATPDGAKGPFVGRSQEMDLLFERWQRVRGGAGQCSLITGEPGIGKSRLARELCGRLLGEAHIYLEGRCSPDTQNNALYAVIELLGRALELDQESSPRGKLTRLEAQLARRGLAPVEAMPLFAPLFGLPIEQPYAPLEATPQRQKELTFNGILALLFGMAEEKPVLLVIEDLHWADPTSLELLGQLAREVPSAAMCLLMTARPEFEPPFPTTGMQQIHLSRLEGAQIEAMVAELLGNKPLPRDVVEQIALRTDGIPLFVEELTRTMLETGVLLERADRYELSRPLSEVEMPGTLRGLLLSRLDRLGRAKETAQVAAALGREFSEEVLLAVSRLEETAVREDLHRLVGAGLVLRKRRMKESAYTFKHALVRDAAYESLPRAARRGVHARIARTLEERFPAIVEARPDLLARHHAEAEQKQEAIGYGQKAAQAALERSANTEAIAHGQAAIKWLDAIDDRRERLRMELALNRIITPAVMATRGYGAAEVEALVLRSQAVLDEIGDGPDAFPTLWASWGHHELRGRHEQAMAIASRSLALANHLNDSGMQVVASIQVGHNMYFEGRWEDARKHLEHALELFDAEAHGRHAFIFGQDSFVHAHALLAHVVWFSGYPERGLSHARKALERAREVAHANSVGLSMYYLCSLHHYRREVEAARDVAQSLIDFATQHTLPTWLIVGQALRFWAMRDADGLRQLLAMFKSAGIAQAQPYFALLLADVLHERGAFDDVLVCLDEGMDLANRGEPCYLPELYRLKGQCLWKKGAKGTAVEYALRSIHLAQASGARMQELLTAVELHRWDALAPDARMRLQEWIRSSAEEQGLFGLLEAQSSTR